MEYEGVHAEFGSAKEQLPALEKALMDRVQQRPPDILGSVKGLRAPGTHPRRVGRPRGDGRGRRAAVSARGVGHGQAQRRFHGGQVPKDRPLADAQLFREI
jgi:hypothetical protein